jgi:hypothetical protein
LASSASFSPATAALPHRAVSFISVVGCGTFPSSGIRKDRRHEIESQIGALCQDFGQLGWSVNRRPDTLPPVQDGQPDRVVLRFQIGRRGAIHPLAP